MITRLENVTLVTPARLFPGSTIDVENGKILAVYTENPTPVKDATVIDCQGNYAMPGFVDIHIHGGGDVDFCTGTPQEIKAGCEAHAQYGTTTIIPTTVTAPFASILNAVKNIRKAADLVTDCTIAGCHLEGPFFSPNQAGAQDPATLLDPNVEMLDAFCQAWPGGIKIMGVAPELKGGLEFGKELKKRGIVATIAHSDANYSTCAEALKNGYTDITHIYSGCSIVHRENAFRIGGVVEAGLVEDDFTVQMIADGCHLPPELLRLVFKCKGADKISLITDALAFAAAGHPEGSTTVAPNGDVYVLEDGVMKLEHRQAFAGSVATTDRLVRNMVNLAGVSLCDAVTMMTRTPARVAGLADRKGSIEPGFDADIVIMDKALQVQSVMAMGRFIR